MKRYIGVQLAVRLQSQRLLVEANRVFARRYPLLLILLYVALSARALFHPGQFAFGDLQPMPLNAEAAWHRYADSWTSAGLGFPQAPLLINLIEAVLLFASFGHPAFVQHVLIGCVIPLALFSSYFLARDLGLSRRGACCSAAVYALNPATIGDMLGGTELSTILGIAILPLVLRAILRLWREPTIGSSIVFGAAVGTEVQIYSHGVPLLFILGVLLVLFDAVVRGAPIEKIRASLFLSVLGCFVAGVFAAPLLAASALFVPLPHAEHHNNITFSAGSIRGFLNDLRYTYSFTTPALVMRLAGVADTLGFSTPFAPSNICGYSLVVWLAVGVVLATKQRRRLPLLFGLTVVAGCLSFVIATHYGLTYGLFLRFPELFAYRNPVQPLMVGALGAGLVAGVVTERLTRSVRTRAVGVALVVAYALYIGRSPLSGDYLISQYHGHARIPNSYYRVADTISKLGPGSYYRVLWLPQSYEGIGIKSGALPLNLLQFQYGAAQFYDFRGRRYLETALASAAAHRTVYLGHMIAPFLALFVVVEKNAYSGAAGAGAQVLTPYRTPYLAGSGSEMLGICNRQEDLRLILNTRHFAIYLNTALARYR